MSDPLTSLIVWAVTHPASSILLAAMIGFVLAAILVSLLTLWLTRT